MNIRRFQRYKILAFLSQRTSLGPNQTEQSLGCCLFIEINCYIKAATELLLLHCPYLTWATFFPYQHKNMLQAALLLYKICVVWLQYKVGYYGTHWGGNSDSVWCLATCTPLHHWLFSSNTMPCCVLLVRRVHIGRCLVKVGQSSTCTGHWTSQTIAVGRCCSVTELVPGRSWKQDNRTSWIRVSFVLFIFN